MLDLFTIFTKGGIVLWYFQGTALSLSPAVNSLVKTVLLQERGSMDVFNHESLKLQFKLDNEFELVFVVVYQRILQLSYMDKLIDQVYIAFRDRYKTHLSSNGSLPCPAHYDDFSDIFKTILDNLEQEHKLINQRPREMKQWDGGSRKKDKKFINGVNDISTNSLGGQRNEDTMEENGGVAAVSTSLPPSNKLKKLMAARNGSKSGGGGTNKGKKGGGGKVVPSGPPKKEARQWMGVVSKDEAKSLDYTNGTNGDDMGDTQSSIDTSLKGTMKGQLQPLTAAKSLQETHNNNGYSATSNGTANNGTTTSSGGTSGGGIFSYFKSLTSGRTITKESIEPVMDKMKEHLIIKNVALEISEKLCDSVAAKLDGKTIGTFSGVQSVVRASMEEALIQILSPRRRIDVLQDALKAKDERRPFVITFCGVNGVGKSTNLAKICFWLLENGLRVLIAACDTFRSGAVEQLRTHKCRLASYHPPDREGGPPRVTLFERGYGKDAAGICMEAINFARQQMFDVVLVDTAGRMQDNEPLMVSLAKLIRVNNPDLVLFVGEALVGNEAVDQLVKFNRALVDFSDPNDANPRNIDGIVLTKFDTIDDKVGAAISMTYVTGQPIVFVGTGQTYQDLCRLDADSVVTALLK